jgi:hypothetical protein
MVRPVRHVGRADHTQGNETEDAMNDDTKVPARELNTKQKITVIAVDVLVLAELCVAMYLANANPDVFTPTFMKCFFSMLVPTMIAGYVSVRLLREKQPQVESTQS